MYIRTVKQNGRIRNRILFTSLSIDLDISKDKMRLTTICKFFTSSLLYSDKVSSSIEFRRLFKSSLSRFKR